MIVNELLKSIKDNALLSECEEPWLDKLIDAINLVIESDDIDADILTNENSGKNLKDTLRLLPANKQINILNDCVISYGKKRRRDIDKKEEQEQQIAIANHRLKHEMIRITVIAFLILLVFLVMGAILIGYRTSTNIDSAIATSIVSTIGELVKLIFGIGT